jgi:hypothetical protein
MHPTETMRPPHDEPASQPICEACHLLTPDDRRDIRHEALRRRIEAMGAKVTRG